METYKTIVSHVMSEQSIDKSLKINGIYSGQGARAEGFITGYTCAAYNIASALGLSASDINDAVTGGDK